MSNDYEIKFPVGYSEREFEIAYKGYVNDVEICSAGLTARLCFIDMARLQQELDEAAQQEVGFFAEPGLVVVSEVSTAIIRAVVHQMWVNGYFAKEASTTQSHGNPHRIASGFSGSVGPQIVGQVVVEPRKYDRFSE